MFLAMILYAGNILLLNSCESEILVDMLEITYRSISTLQLTFCTPWSTAKAAQEWNHRSVVLLPPVQEHVIVHGTVIYKKQQCCTVTLVLLVQDFHQGSQSNFGAIIRHNMDLDHLCCPKMLCSALPLKHPPQEGL